MFSKRSLLSVTSLIRNVSQTDIWQWWLPWVFSIIESAEQGCEMIGLKRKTVRNLKTNETERYLFSSELLAGNTHPLRPTTAFVAWIAAKLHEENLIWVAPRILADFSKGKALAENKNVPWMPDLARFIKDASVFRSPRVTDETFTLMGWLTAQLELSYLRGEGASNDVRSKRLVQRAPHMMPDPLDIVSVALALQYDLTLVTAKSQLKKVKTAISSLKLITVSDLAVQPDFKGIPA